MIIQLVFLLISLWLGYIWFWPYIKKIDDKKKAIKQFAAFCFIAWGFAALIWFYDRAQHPESFREGVRLLKTNRQVMEKIGDFESYSYYQYNMPKDTANPAIFSVSFEGSMKTIYLTCKIRKDDTGTWHLIEIKQDSLVATRIKIMNNIIYRLSINNISLSIINV